MTKIKIITDSTAGLIASEIEKYQIEVLPLSIEIDGTIYNSATDLTIAEFIEKMSCAHVLPKSSQPPLGTFVEVYKKAIQEGYEVLSLHLTENLSGTVNTARQAAKIVKGNIAVIDTDYIARAQAFQVIEAAKMAQKNKYTLEEIKQKLEIIRSKTKLYIVVVTLENLIKGGRVGKVRGIIGNLLNIKLIAKLKDGALEEEAKVRSTKKAISYLSNLINNETEKIIQLDIMQASGLKAASELKANTENKVENRDIPIFDADPVIATHAGSGAFALMYYTE